MQKDEKICTQQGENLHSRGFFSTEICIRNLICKCELSHYLYPHILNMISHILAQVYLQNQSLCVDVQWSLLYMSRLVLNDNKSVGAQIPEI